MAGKQNNQEQNEEEQLGMDQEDKLEKATKQGFAMGMGFFKGKAKGVAQVATKKLIATISAAVAPFAFTIMIVLMVVIMIATLLDMLGMNIFTNEDNSSAIGNSSLMQMFEINENGIAMKNPDEFMQNFKKRLEENGMNIRSLGLGNEEQTKKYLLRFYRASMATQIPYIATSEVKGIMRIKRTSTTVEEARELTWVTHERFTQMLEAKDTSIQNYYALDENWNLCVSTMVENRAEGTITQTLTEIKIPYQSLVSQYSVPFRYLMTMLQITRNPQYIDYMCSMFVEGKQIDFTIFDSIQTTTNTTTYSHSIMKKWIEEPEEEEDDDFDDYDDDYDDEEEGELREDGPIEQPDEVTTTVTITNTITANVTYANTWLVELKNDYTNQSSTEYPLGEAGQLEELEPEEEPEDPESADDGVITWDVKRTNLHQSESVKNTWEQAGTNGQIKESEFLGLWKNATGTPQVGAPYDPSGIEVQYNLPETIHPRSPLPNILTSEDFLFELLERYEDTQSYSDIMKYMLYIYTGKDYGVTSLDIDIFKADDFVSMTSTSGIGGGGLNDFIEWLHKWEGHEGISADGTQYLIGTDGYGHPTVGYGIDIFNGGYASIFEAAGYPTTVGSYVDKAFVDELERKEIEECITYIKNATSSLGLKDYQIYALVSRAFNCGKQSAVKERNGKTFVEAYMAYWNEEVDNRYGESTTNFSHLLYTQYMNKPDTSDGKYVKGLEERRKAEWTLFTTGYYDRTGKFHQDSPSGGNSGFLGVAESIWNQICTSGRFTAYGGTNIPPKGPNIDCSSYVSWVLYQYGYTEFAGWQKNTSDFYHTNWSQKYGWEEIPVGSGQSPIDILQPGDMFVRYEGHGSGQTHHILIVTYIENGKLYGYDCGAANNWLNAKGEAIDRSYFLTKKGPGKIMRIKENNTANT